METKQVDLTQMTELELWKFISEQQEQVTNLVVALNQIQQNITNAKKVIDDRSAQDNQKDTSPVQTS